MICELHINELYVSKTLSVVVYIHTIHLSECYSIDIPYPLTPLFPFIPAVIDKSSVQKFDVRNVTALQVLSFALVK